MSTLVSQSVRVLKDAYRGQRAAVIMGGTSLVDARFEYGRLRERGFVTFLESKALTPGLLAQGFEPDFFLMLSADKCLHSALHNWIFRAMLAQVDVRWMLRPEGQAVADDMAARRDELFEAGNVTRGAHKRYRWRPNVRLENAPGQLLPRLSATKILAERASFTQYYPEWSSGQQRYEYEQVQTPQPFSREAYYDLVEADGRVTVGNFAFHNSAAIALYPLLRYLGFRTVYFLGMDMTMLGSLEYGAPYAFKSMAHFWWFFRRTRHVFNADFRPNQPWYLRPAGEFSALQQVLDPSRVELVRVVTPYRYAASTPFMSTMALEEFWRA